MQLNKIVHYAKRVVELGPRTSAAVLKNRVQKKRFYTHWKRKAERGAANHQWELIADRYDVRQSFPLYFLGLKRNFTAFFPVELVRPLAYDEQIIEKADCFVKKEFDLLGSCPVQFSSIPWHEDFRLRSQKKNADCTFDPGLFYQDIKVQPGGQQFLKDIKVPWELSRFYHFSVLGQAYQKTCDKAYAQAFVQQASDWIQKNRFMLGPNWVCPMEVGIRAINWICAFHFFKDASCIADEFWERFVCSLYDHFFYLEHNWEVYDSRTSNHYLSDLVGYFSLCFFFQKFSGVPEKKIWCFHEILREFNKQVFDEGTDYEGSTAYHRLVTELFYIFEQLCRKSSLILSDNFSQKLVGMFDFIQWCTPHDGTMITVGDDDSGKVLYHGISQCMVDELSTKSEKTTRDFHQFGLSVIKTKKWHMTVRHHAYNKRQPSGHFHNDAGSITLAVDGTPVFVDPGSFVYTPSSMWRNRFRCAAVHNTFYLDGIEPVSLDGHLFGLDLPPFSQQGASFRTTHRLYQRLGLVACRIVSCDKDLVTLTDRWIVDGKYRENMLSLAQSCWNFTLSPNIQAEYRDGVWHFNCDGKTVLRLYSKDFSFELDDSWYSPHYGAKLPTHCLRAQVPLELNKEFLIELCPA